MKKETVFDELEELDIEQAHSRRRIDLRNKKRAKEVLISRLVITAIMIVVLMIGIVIGANVSKNRIHPAIKLTGNETHLWTLTPGEEGAKIYENFWNFARASYILIGTIPDCQMYKIAVGAPRNNYVIENFFTDASDGKMYYHDEQGTKNSTIVLDVSEFQTEVHWDQVKAAGVDAAMIRVGYRGYSEGTLVEDAMFARRIEAALAEGIQIGVYFYSQAINYEEGCEEANYVLSKIKDYDVTFPVAIDTEYLDVAEARAYNLDNAARTDAIVGFCETVKAAGYTPMIYSNRNWFATSLDMSRLTNYKLWLAQYADAPDFPYVYTGWQYTETGSLSGINGNVDLSVWMQ